MVTLKTITNRCGKIYTINDKNETHKIKRKDLALQADDFDHQTRSFLSAKVTDFDDGSCF